MEWNNPSRKIVSGIFNSEEDIDFLFDELEDLGVHQEDISILLSDRTRDYYGGTGSRRMEESSKLPEGASIGGVSGGILGGLLGSLTMAGSLLIPGAGLLVAGPIIGAITGGAVGTAAGGLVGALIGAGIPEHEAKFYEESLQTEGNILLVAHVMKEQVEDVSELFREYGVRELNVRLESDSPVQ